MDYREECCLLQKKYKNYINIHYDVTPNPNGKEAAVHVKKKYSQTIVYIMATSIIDSTNIEDTQTPSGGKRTLSAILSPDMENPGAKKTDVKETPTKQQLEPVAKRLYEDVEEAGAPEYFLKALNGLLSFVDHQIKVLRK